MDSSTWKMCHHCALVFYSISGCWPTRLLKDNDILAVKSPDIPSIGTSWHFTGKSAYLCDHLYEGNGNPRGAGVYKGKFTRKILGHRSLADQEAGKGSPASKMKPYYRP